MGKTITWEDLSKRDLTGSMILWRKLAKTRIRSLQAIEIEGSNGTRSIRLVLEDDPNLQFPLQVGNEKLTETHPGILAFKNNPIIGSGEIHMLQPLS